MGLLLIAAATIAAGFVGVAMFVLIFGFRCAPGHHEWVRVYGDQILARHGMYVCRRCGRSTDNPGPDDAVR